VTQFLSFVARKKNSSVVWYVVYRLLTEEMSGPYR
jgi:hypothetical protein